MDYPVRDGAGGVILSGGASGPRTPAAVYDSGPQTTLNLDLLSLLVNGWTDVSDCLEVAVQVIGSAGISAGAVIFEQTNDPTVAALNTPVTEFNVAGGAQVLGAVAIAASASRIFLVPVVARFMRVRVSTAFVGGTVRAFAMGRNIDAEVRQPGGGAVAAAGNVAHDSPISGNPVRIGGRAVATNLAVVAANDVADLVTTLSGVLVTKPYNVPEMDWSFAAPAGGVINTTDVALAPARGATLRNYITSIQLRNASATVATEVVLKDGAATVIWRGQLPINSGAEDFTFPSPLKTSLNAVLNFACITTGAQVYVNAQGYQAP
jgi:hypothetical protein